MLNTDFVINSAKFDYFIWLLIKFALVKSADFMSTVNFNFISKHYFIAVSCNYWQNLIWIYDIDADIHVSNDIKMFTEMHDIEFKLNDVIRTNWIIKMRIMKISFKLLLLRKNVI